MMFLMVKKWRSIDDAAVDLVLKWMKDTEPATTIRSLSQALNMTEARLQQLLRKKTKQPMSLGVFHACAIYFHKSPVDAYVLAAQIAAIYDGDYSLAGTYHAAYQDLAVNNAVQTLAKAYLDSRDIGTKLAEQAATNDEHEPIAQKMDDLYKHL